MSSVKSCQCGVEGEIQLRIRLLINTDHNHARSLKPR